MSVINIFCAAAAQRQATRQQYYCHNFRFHKNWFLVVLRLKLFYCSGFMYKTFGGLDLLLTDSKKTVQIFAGFFEMTVEWRCFEMITFAGVHTLLK